MAKLQPEWEERLKTESLSRRILGDLRLEDNAVGVEDISSIVKDDPNRDDKAADVAMRVGIIRKEKDIQQVLNLLNVNKFVEQVSYLSNKFRQGDFGQKDLTQINALVGEKIVSSDSLGNFRFDDFDDTTFFLKVIPSVEVAFQTEDLFVWMKGANRHEIHPILKAGVVLYELLRINPFIHGNFLTCLSYFYLLVASEGYDFKKIWSPEDEMTRNRESLVQALLSVEKNNGDMTTWLEFVIRMLGDASEKAKVRVLNLVGDTPIIKSENGRAISLSERQIVIMEDMTIKNEMTIKEIRTLLPLVSDDTLLRDVKNLIEKKLIKKKGKTKGAVYILGKVRNFK